MIKKGRDLIRKKMPDFERVYEGAVTVAEQARCYLQSRLLKTPPKQSQPEGVDNEAGDQPGDGGLSQALYTSIPCTIGYNYARIEVDGSMKLCCVSHHEIGNIYESSFDEIWQSNRAEAFRKKLLKIDQDQFHLSDPEWGYCRHCSHVSINRENAEDFVPV